jgi:hypothetical protein
MDGILARPVMHPYGYASRAPKGTVSVTARQGEHTGNRLVLGHRAPDRPNDLAVGDSVMYSVGDYRVKITSTQILISKGTDYEPLVVGETLRQFLIALIELIVEHKHVCSAPSAPGGPPMNFADFQELGAENLDNEKILAKDGGRY